MFILLQHQEWETAIRECKEKAGSDFAKKATLASINTIAENKFIKTSLLSKNVKRAWIGLGRKELGEQRIPS